MHTTSQNWMKSSHTASPTRIVRFSKPPNTIKAASPDRFDIFGSSETDTQYQLSLIIFYGDFSNFPSCVCKSTSELFLHHTL